MKKCGRALEERIILVSVMYANIPIHKTLLNVQFVRAFDITVASVLLCGQEEVDQEKVNSRGCGRFLRLPVGKPAQSAKEKHARENTMALQQVIRQVSQSYLRQLVSADRY